MISLQIRLPRLLQRPLLSRLQALLLRLLPRRLLTN